MKRVTLSCRSLAHSKKDGIGIYTEELGRALTQLNQLAVRVQHTNIKQLAFNLLHLPTNYNYKTLDLLHITDYLIPRTRKVPLIATLHDAVPIQYPEWVSPRYRTFKNHILRSTIKYLSHVIALSHAVVPDLVNYWQIEPEKITVVYSGVAKKWFEPVTEQQRQQVLQKYNITKKYLLFVGTLQPRKNICRLLQAYRLLPHKIKKQYQIIIIGQAGWRNDDAFRYIDEITRSNQGLWLDYVSSQDLPALYQGAEIFLFPSLYEGFGLPILEAFASNVPVITSNVSSMPEVSGDAAVLIEPYSIDAIRDGIVRLIDDQELRERCRERGQIRAQQFTWESCAKETFKVYQKFMT